MADAEDQQVTPGGATIPVPSRDAVFDALRRVSKPKRTEEDSDTSSPEDQS